MHRYGVTGSDIHAWMDEPSQLYGSSHRWTRHNAKMVPKKFIEKYGAELARAIMIDHILLDRKNYKIIIEKNLDPYEFTAGDKITLLGFFFWIFLIYFTVHIYPPLSLSSLWGFVLPSVVYFGIILFYYNNEKNDKIQD